MIRLWSHEYAALNGKASVCVCGCGRARVAREKVWEQDAMAHNFFMFTSNVIFSSNNTLYESVCFIGLFAFRSIILFFRFFGNLLQKENSTKNIRTNACGHESVITRVARTRGRVCVCELNRSCDACYNRMHLLVLSFGCLHSHSSCSQWRPNINMCVL